MVKLKIGKSYSISGPETGLGKHFNDAKEILITSEDNDYYTWTSGGSSGRFGNVSVVAYSTQFTELASEQQILIFN